MFIEVITSADPNDIFNPDFVIYLNTFEFVITSVLPLKLPYAKPLNIGNKQITEYLGSSLSCVNKLDNAFMRFYSPLKPDEIFKRLNVGVCSLIPPLTNS